MQNFIETQPLWIVTDTADVRKLTLAEAVVFAALGNPILADADTGCISLEIPPAYQLPLDSSDDNPVEAAKKHELQRVESLAELAQKNGTPLTADFYSAEKQWRGDFVGTNLKVTSDEAAMIIGVSKEFPIK